MQVSGTQPYHRTDEVFGKKMQQVMLDGASALSVGRQVSTCHDYHTGWELQGFLLWEPGGKGLTHSICKEVFCLTVLQTCSLSFIKLQVTVAHSSVFNYVGDCF